MEREETKAVAGTRDLLTGPGLLPSLLGRESGRSGSTPRAPFPVP